MNQDAESEDLEASADHYVYLYRDARGEVRYVGYGKSTERATSHLVQSHNEQLNEFLDARQYRIEIAGPFENEHVGHAVETALISTLKPKFNVDRGPSRWRFRPLGVPLKFADRQVEPELILKNFLSAQGPDPSPVLFVIITSVNFEGERIGYNPANPPTDAQIRSRIDRWWQIERSIRAWEVNPESSPGLLIGVFGSPGRQTVIASARIDLSRWTDAERPGGGKISVPLVEPTDLDAFSLRGRRIGRSAGLTFGRIPAQFFIVLSVNEIAVGGSIRRIQS